MTVKKKVALLSLEGLPFELLQQITESAGFPQLKSWLDGSKKVKLASPWSNAATAWATVATGVGPGHHAIFSDYKRLPGTYQVVGANGRARQAPPFWRILDENGYSLGLFNLPLSYPPEAVNGFFVAGSDLPGPDSPFTYPNGLYTLLEKNFGFYQADVDYTLADKQAYLQDIAKLAAHQSAVVKLLTHKFSRVEALFIAFTALDRLLHLIDWRDIVAGLARPAQAAPDIALARDIVLNFFAELEEWLGRLLNEAHFNLLLLVPYGQQPVDRVINLNERLIAAGLLKLKPAGAGQPPTIDWAQSQAYSLGQAGHIYLNRAGREPAGIVEAGRPAKLARQRVQAALTGQWPGASLPAEDIYAGPYFDSAPDLVLDLPAGYHVTNHLPELEPEPGPNLAGIWPHHPPCGQHSKEGYLLYPAAMDPAIQPEGALALADVAPTILNWLGLAGPALEPAPAKAANLELLHQQLEQLEQALELKQTEFRVQAHTLEPLRREVEQLRQQTAGLQREVHLLRSGRVMRLLLAQSRFFNKLKRKFKP
jgi:predicted AlkP superfamily phosphohydrolase/phosphomutase